MKKWTSLLPDCGLKESPISKTAAELIAEYDAVKIKDLKFIDGLDPRVSKNIETELKYRVYIEKMTKVVVM